MLKGPGIFFNADLQDHGGKFATVCFDPATCKNLERKLEENQPYHIYRPGVSPKSEYSQHDDGFVA